MQALPFAARNSKAAWRLASLSAALAGGAYTLSHDQVLEPIC
jgi:hypothetical protein